VKLVFGVNNIRYGTDPTTAGDVANWLEKKYGIMGAFVQMNKDFIAKEVIQELVGVKNRQPQHPMDAIAKKLKEAISMQQFNGILPGVPTKASLRGVSSRFKNGKRRGKSKVSGVPRPSFIDSGIYQSSIRVVLDESK
jgi:hypothetical protein